MGINVTPAGLDYICQNICTFKTDPQGRTAEEKYQHQQNMIERLCDILDAEIVYEPITIEQLLALNIGPVIELKEGNRGKLNEHKYYGRWSKGGYYLEHHAPSGHVVKGWHKTLIKQLRKKPNKEEAELLFKVGQTIINGKQDGYRND